MSQSAMQIPGYVAGVWDIDPVQPDPTVTVRPGMVSKVRGRFNPRPVMRRLSGRLLRRRPASIGLPFEALTREPVEFLSHDHRRHYCPHDLGVLVVLSTHRPGNSGHCPIRGPVYEKDGILTRKLLPWHPYFVNGSVPGRSLDEPPATLRPRWDTETSV
jgi:hypothetical protein